MSASSFFLCLTCLIGLGDPAAHERADQDEIVVDQAVVLLIDNVAVPAEQAGVIEEFLATEGEQVDAGQVVVKLHSELYQLEVEIARRELEAATLASESDVNLRYANKSRDVAKKILERNLEIADAVSKTEIERLQLEYERSILAGERAEMDQKIAVTGRETRSAELRAAELKMAQRNIRSPIAGQVVELLAQRGEWINVGDPLLRVVRLDRLRVGFFLDADKFDSRLVGKPVDFRVAMPPDGEEQSFRGVVTFVSPEVIPNRGQIRVWAEIENPHLSLRPGTAGALHISLK